MYTKEIYTVEGGYGYRILCDGVPIIEQPFHPEKDGFVPMTKTQANACADTVLGRLVG